MNEYGLIGYPLQHSFSKKYFTDKFEREGLNNCIFNLFPLPSITDLTTLLHTHKDLKGLAVTIPFKVEVIPFLDKLDDTVERIAAVNCIQITDGKLTGFNTDVTGFEKTFTPFLKNHHSGALILGTGGASKAVQYVLNKIGMPFLVVTRSENSQSLHIPYKLITGELLKNYPVIINCTPVGMYPDDYKKPDIPYHLLSALNYLYDLVYNPSRTLFLKEGEKYGAVVKNGFDMLVIQAEENWKIWNGNGERI